MNIDLSHANTAHEDWKITTQTIQAVIDNVSSSGGGRVTLGVGTYVVGGLRLANGVELFLDENTILHGTFESGAYPGDAWGRVVWAKDATDISLTGNGLLDCRSRFEKLSVPPGPPLPHTTYVGGHYRNINSPRPVLFHDCRNVRISDVRLHNGGEWHCYLLHCDHALVENITIRQTTHSTWTDGIDLESCRDVVVRNCDVQTGDDAVCIKAGKRGSEQSSHNILVEDCTLSSETNGFKIGNEVSHDISNVTVRNCVIRSHPDREAAGPFGGIAIQSANGATVSNVHVHDITLEDPRAPIFIKLGRGGGYKPDSAVSAMRNIVIERVTSRVTGAKDQQGITSSITGFLGHCVENVVLRDIDIEVPGGETPDPGPVPDLVDRYIEAPVFGVMPAYGLFARFVRNLTLHNVRFRAVNPDTRPDMIMESVHGLDRK